MSAAAETELAIQHGFRSRIRQIAPAIKLVAVPNAAKRGQRAMNQARKEGAAWGFPDLLAIAPGGKIAFIEMKRPGEKPRPNQADWLARLAHYDFPVAVVCSVDEGVAFLREHGFPFVFGDAS